MSEIIKETKAQRVERLEPSQECVGVYRRDSRIRAAGARLHSAGVAGDLFSFMGDLHAGRWARSDRWRER